jgi:hypothetical protein
VRKIQKESRVITKDLVESLRSGHYQVTTIIPSAENPIMNIYHFNQEEFNDFFEEYMEHAEFIVSVVQAPPAT